MPFYPWLTWMENYAESIYVLREHFSGWVAREGRVEDWPARESLYVLGLVRENNEAAVQCSPGERDQHVGTGARCPTGLEKPALPVSVSVVTAIVSAVGKFSWICGAFVAGAKANSNSWELRSSADLKGEKGDRGAPGPPGTLNLRCHWRLVKEYVWLEKQCNKLLWHLLCSLNCLKPSTYVPRGTGTLKAPKANVPRAEGRDLRRRL